MKQSPVAIAMFRFSRIFRKTSPKKNKNFLLHKKNARILAEERIAYFGAVYQLRPNKVSIRNQRTRWGSCSKKGNINFHYTIALLPERLADYIIVHELCHLGEFNHSRQFWALVEKAIPDHRARRHELRLIRPSILRTRTSFS